jgi:hypothetical protein
MMGKGKLLRVEMEFEDGTVQELRGDAAEAWVQKVGVAYELQQDRTGSQPQDPWVVAQVPGPKVDVEREACRADMLAWAREWWAKSPQHVVCKMLSPPPTSWWGPAGSGKAWSRPWVPAMAAEVLAQVKQENAGVGQ